MSLHTITAEQAVAMMQGDDALLIDVREATERAALFVPGSEHLPLTRLAQARLPLPADRPVIFHCVNGTRTAAAAGALASLAREAEAYIVAGGLEGLRRAGAPVVAGPACPWQVIRQAQVMAGGLALGGVVAGALVDPAFHALAALVGGWLLVTGLTGTCPVQRALAALPWNRQPA